MIKVISLILVFAVYSAFMFWLGRGYGIEEYASELRKRIPYKTWLKATQGIEIKTVDDFKNEIVENQRNYVKDCIDGNRDEGSAQRRSVEKAVKQ